jgi:hypothetical protein
MRAKEVAVLAKIVRRRARSRMPNRRRVFIVPDAILFGTFRVYSVYQEDSGTRHLKW